MLFNTLKRIVKEETKKYLKETSSLDRAIVLLKRGGKIDQEKDSATKRIRAAQTDTDTAITNLMDLV
tara:strand:- start:7 stop:207 length:201 start_codon:yes stop_codon:yes gene_type:complete